MQNNEKKHNTLQIMIAVGIFLLVIIQGTDLYLKYRTVGEMQVQVESLQKELTDTITNLQSEFSDANDALGEIKQTCSTINEASDKLQQGISDVGNALGKLPF